MKRGELVALGPPKVIFGLQWDPSWGLELPWTAEVANTLEQFPNLSAAPVTFTIDPPLNAEELEALIFNEKVAIQSERFGEPSLSEQLHDPTMGDGIGTGSVAGLDAGVGGDDFSGAQGGPGAPGEKKRRGRQKTGIEFFKNVNLGQFLDRPSALRDLGSRKKLALVTVLFILTIVAPSVFISLSVLTFVLAVGVVAGRVKPPYLLRGLIPALPYVTFMILLQLFFPWPGDPSVLLFSLGPLGITVNAFHRSLLLLFKLLALMALLSLYTAVTPLGETIRSISKSLLPLFRLGFPVREFSLALGITLRFVPILAEEAERITVAQLSRGGGYQGKGRIRSATAMTVPLFLRSLERAESLATAMELRLFEIH
jgi:energy-coupling factor transporter transmembrane protein EcfT